MIEEHARVVAIDGHDIWIETQRRSACGQCAANKGCGTAVLGQVLGVKRNVVRILNPSDTKVSVGDEIVVGIQEQALIRGSLAIYIVPLLALFLFGLLGELLASQFHISSHDIIVLISGILGLVFGFMWVKRFSARISNDSRYQPVLLRRQMQARYL
jgi:sigma-E factor negative regulatory protein RseC